MKAQLTKPKDFSLFHLLSLIVNCLVGDATATAPFSRQLLRSWRSSFVFHNMLLLCSCCSSLSPLEILCSPEWFLPWFHEPPPPQKKYDSTLKMAENIPLNIWPFQHRMTFYMSGKKIKAVPVPCVDTFSASCNLFNPHTPSVFQPWSWWRGSWMPLSVCLRSCRPPRGSTIWRAAGALMTELLTDCWSCRPQSVWYRIRPLSHCTGQCVGEKSLHGSNNWNMYCFLCL